MATCKGCGQDIYWIHTKAGKVMPVDPDPVMVIVGEGRDKFVTDEGEILVGREATYEEASMELPVGFIPHWKTCPNAGDFRRR